MLSLLYERSMHPYEMRTLMRERGHDQVVRVKGGSLYDTVERLSRLGLIESTETNREGRRPERTVYAITASGRDELRDWLRELLSVPIHEYPQFIAALAFIAVLEPGEWVPLLAQRATALETEIAAGDAMLRASVEGIGLPRLFLIEGEFAQAMRRAELEWVRTTITEMQEGRLAMPGPKVLEALTEASRRRQEADQ